MKKRFTDVLSNLGHSYVEAPNGSDRHSERIRHIGIVLQGEIVFLCGKQRNPEDTLLGCSALWADSNCESCLKEAKIQPHLTKRGLMLNTVNLMVSIEQIFLDAMYWNHHNPQTPINPDPDGELARQWQENKNHLIEMLDRCQPMMERHENTFGWAEEF